MPTYQYACTECGHEFDQFQNFTDDALTVCPECNGALRKVFSAAGVVFKGSGFYRTDSRSAATVSDSSSGSTEKSSASTSTSGSGSSKSSDSASSTPAASTAD